MADAYVAMVEPGRAYRTPLDHGAAVAGHRIGGQALVGPEPGERRAEGGAADAEAGGLLDYLTERGAREKAQPAAGAAGQGCWPAAGLGWAGRSRQTPGGQSTDFRPRPT